VAFSAFKLVLGAMHLDGTGKLDLTGARPSFDGAFHAGALDLDALLALLPLRAGAGSGPWSEKKLDLTGLGMIDARAGFEGDALTLGRLPFQTPKFSLALKDGTLDLDGVKTGLYGGGITANLVLRGGDATPAIGASVKFIQLDGAQLTETLWGRSFFTGGIGGAFTLTAQGDSTAALASAAQGTLALKSGAGSIQGIESKNAEAVTAFTDLALDGQLQAGILTLSAGQMKTASGVAGVAGNLSLPAYTLDLTVSADKMPPLHFGGPLDKPARATNAPAGLAAPKPAAPETTARP
jgi:hypothetical protein